MIATFYDEINNVGAGLVPARKMKINKGGHVARPYIKLTSINFQNSTKTYAHKQYKILLQNTNINITKILQKLLTFSAKYNILT